MDTEIAFDLVKKGEYKKMYSLVRDGFNVNKKNSRGKTLLHIAASDMNTATIDILIAHGADINAKDKRGDTPLHLSAEEGSREIAVKLIEHGASLTIKSKMGLYPVHHAIIFDHVDMVKELIQRGSTLNSTSRILDSPLILSIRSKNHEMVSLLLKHGIDIDVVGISDEIMGLPIIDIAIHDGTPEILKLLLESGVTATENTHQQIIHDVFHKKFDMFDILVKYGFDMYHQDTKSKNMMDYSILASNTDAITHIVEKGYDLEKLNSNGHTPLITAAIDGRANVVKHLLDLGANMNTPDNRGVTALVHASRGSKNVFLIPDIIPSISNHERVSVLLASRGASGDEAYRRKPFLKYIRKGGLMKYSKEVHESIGKPEKLRDIISIGGNVDSPLDDGYTPLMRACTMNSLESAKLLVYAGANVNKRGVDNSTAIIIASRFGSTEIVKFLLDKGADIGMSTHTGSNSELLNPIKRLFRRETNVNDGYTALMMACFNGHVETSSVLLDGGADINDIGPLGNTSLHASIINNRTDIIQLLVKRGANVNISNVDGHTPIMLATVMGYIPIVDILQANGGISDTKSLNLRRIYDDDDDNDDDDYCELPKKNMYTTFKTGDFSKEITGDDSRIGVCRHIDQVWLSDGRCVGVTTPDARRVMMALLNKPIDRTKIVFPVQKSGTCWYFSSIGALFLSDMMSSTMIPIRRSMIMGRKTPNSNKFPQDLRNSLAKLNMMIQASIQGNSTSTDKQSVLSIVNNEGITVELVEAGLISNYLMVPSLNTGFFPMDFITDILKLLEPYEGFVKYNRLVYVPGIKMHGGNNENKSASIHIETIIPTNIKDISLEKTINGRVYKLDALSITSLKNKHAIAGVTVNQKLYIFDSNSGLVDIDWYFYLRNPSIEFEVNKRKYKMKRVKIIGFYCLEGEP